MTTSKHNEHSEDRYHLLANGDIIDKYTSEEVGHISNKRELNDIYMMNNTDQQKAIEKYL